MSDDRTSITIWALTDGMPGHFNQTKGVLRVLSSSYHVEIKWIDAKLRMGCFRSVLRILINGFRKAPPVWLQKFFYSNLMLPGGVPDIVVSAGGKTSFLNAWLSRSLKCKNIFIGSLRRLKADVFSAVITIESIGSDNNIVLPYMPIANDIPDKHLLKKLMGQCEERNCSRVWAILIGGDGAGYRYSAQDWEALADLLVRISHELGVCWLLTTSRRTGKDAEEILKRRIPNELLCSAVWYAVAPKEVISEYLLLSEKILCTEDSMSMLAEAMSSGKGVLSLRPSCCHCQERYSQAISRYEKGGFLFRIDLSSSERYTIDSLNGFRPDCNENVCEMLRDGINRLLVV